LSPTVSSAAPRVDHQQNEPLTIDGEVVGQLREQWYCYTGLFNLTGHPALSVPAGFDAEGLPLGIQLVAPWDAEARLLGAAAALEEMMPWASHWPALAQAGGVLSYPPAR